MSTAARARALASSALRMWPRMKARVDLPGPVDETTAASVMAQVASDVEDHLVHLATKRHGPTLVIPEPMREALRAVAHLFLQVSGPARPLPPMPGLKLSPLRPRLKARLAEIRDRFIQGSEGRLSAVYVDNALESAIEAGFEHSTWFEVGAEDRDEVVRDLVDAITSYESGDFRDEGRAKAYRAALALLQRQGWRDS